MNEFENACEMDFNFNVGLVNCTFQQHDERITMRHIQMVKSWNAKVYKKNNFDCTKTKERKENIIVEKVRT